MPNLQHWLRYHVGDIEFAFRYCSPLAEGVAHRLMRVYWRRDRDIPSDDKTLAKLARVSLVEYRNVRHELEDVLDLTGPSLRIRLLDDIAAQAHEVSRRRSEAGKKGASKRWQDPSSDNGGMANE